MRKPPTTARKYYSILIVPGCRKVLVVRSGMTYSEAQAFNDAEAVLPGTLRMVGVFKQF